jgi:hypothetical protein
MCIRSLPCAKSQNRGHARSRIGALARLIYPIHGKEKVNVEFGNAGALDTKGTGWFIGFSEWAQSPTGLRYLPRGSSLQDLCVKWYLHPAGDPNGTGKPVSEGTTFSVLVGQPGEFEIEFSHEPGFVLGELLVHTLRKPGDFVIWGEGLYHRWAALRTTCILTVRWSEKRGQAQT